MRGGACVSGTPLSCFALRPRSKRRAKCARLRGQVHGGPKPRSCKSCKTRAMMRPARAQARCMLSFSLETHVLTPMRSRRCKCTKTATGAHRYVDSEISRPVRVPTRTRLQLHVANHRKAIALFNARCAKRPRITFDAATRLDLFALARVYRYSTSTRLPRQLATRSSCIFATPATGGMAEAYRGLALECLFEGAYEES